MIGDWLKPSRSRHREEWSETEWRGDLGDYRTFFRKKKSFGELYKKISEKRDKLHNKNPPSITKEDFWFSMVDGGTPNIRTFIENYDRVKEKYGKDF